MIQGVEPILYISDYNPLRFVERSLFATCSGLNPNETLYHDYNTQPQTEIQPYAQPYSYSDQLRVCFYSRYVQHQLILVDICNNDEVIETFNLSPLPNQTRWTIEGVGVEISNEPGVSSNSIVKLVTQVLGAIQVNNNTYDHTLMPSLIGENAIIETVDGQRLVEAKITGFGRGNVDWLMLDKQLDLSSFTNTQITLKIMERYDKALYHDHIIDLCDYPQSVYKLVLYASSLPGYDTDDYTKTILNVSREVESECFDLKKTQPGTNLVKYKNQLSEVGDNQVRWSDFQSYEYFELRLEGQFLPAPSQIQRGKIFRTTSNIQVLPYVNTSQQYTLNVNFVPFYVHQKLAIVLNSDYVRINGLSVIASEEYKPEAMKRTGKSKGKILLTQQAGYVENLS